MKKATTPRITRAPSKPATTPKPVTTPVSGTGTTTPKPTTTTRPAAKPKFITRPKPKGTPTPTPKPITTPVVGPPVVVTLPAPITDNGPMNQIPPESPTPPPVVSLPVPPLIITVGPVTPVSNKPGIFDRPSIVEWSLNGTPKPPATTDGVLSGGTNLDMEAPVLSKPDATISSGVHLDATQPNPEKPASTEWTNQHQAPAPQPTPTPPTKDGVLTGGINLDKAVPTQSEATGVPLITTMPLPTPSVPVIAIPPNRAIEDVSSIQVGDVIIIAIKVMPRADSDTAS
jgi:hypothetical protein